MFQGILGPILASLKIIRDFLLVSFSKTSFYDTTSSLSKDTTILNIFSCRYIHFFCSIRHCTSFHYPSLFWRTQVRCQEDGLHSMMWKNLAFLHHSIWTLLLSLGRLNRARPLARSYDQRGNCSWLVFLAWRVSRHSSYRLRTLCLWWCHYLWRCNSAPRNESSQLNSLREIHTPFL